MSQVVHSTFDAAGREAERIIELFYWMFGFATVVWFVVIGLSVYAIFSNRMHSERWTRFLVLGGGAFFPTLLLTILLAYGLSMMPDLHRSAPQDALTIRVSGVRWWWRVEYLDEQQNVLFETANEIRIPVDRSVEFKLISEDVIHSFWIPALGGKVDMIPGRETRMCIEPFRTGEFAGVCAEYCGGAHALMKFRCVVLESEEFKEWITSQQQTVDIGDTDAGPGMQVFFKRGCSACHAIQGTRAVSGVGPDLTHLASRRTLGAGIIVNSRENLQRWILQTHQMKPGVEMPSFSGLQQEDEFTQLIDFLESLR